MAEITIANIRDFIVNGKLCLPENAVYVGREVKRYGLQASTLANPYKIGAPLKQFPGCPLLVKNCRADRETVIEKYIEWLECADLRVAPELARLTDIARKGPLVLVCWCAPKRCHAEVIRDVLEARQ